MTTRDRLIGMGLAAALILLAVWFLLVSPEKKQVSKLNEEVATARQSLAAAQQKLSGARTAEAQYSTAYASIVRMGEAVPPSAQVPALVYDLDQLSNSKHIDFNSITASGASSSSSSSSSSSASSSSSGGFKQLPVSLTFSGSFFDLYNLFNQLDGLATENENGEVLISGRLLTIQGVSLTVNNESSAATAASSKKSGGESKLTGTVTATAYSLPGSQGLTAGATPAGPAGASTPQPASGAGQTPSTPAAVVGVTP
jgi:Tfp pilus assembly protein PilO